MNSIDLILFSRFINYPFELPFPSIIILTSLTHPDILEKKPSSSESFALKINSNVIRRKLSKSYLFEVHVQLEANLQQKFDWESTRRYPFHLTYFYFEIKTFPAFIDETIKLFLLSNKCWPSSVYASIPNVFQW